MAAGLGGVPGSERRSPADGRWSGVSLYQGTDMSQSIRLNSQDSYEIKIYGQLNDSRLGWFAEANAHVEVLADSSQVYTFFNVVMDQAGLVGLIRRLHGHRMWTVKN